MKAKINKFLLQQTKMNYVKGIEAERGLLGWAIYSARYIQNDMQFGRVVIWNGKNELLSVKVDLCRWWCNITPLFIHNIFPLEFSDIVLQRFNVWSDSLPKDFTFKIKYPFPVCQRASERFISNLHFFSIWWEWWWWLNKEVSKLKFGEKIS